MKKVPWFLFPILLLGCKNNPPATIEIPSIFSDNMVLQQQVSVPIWGWASPGSTITIDATWGKNTSAKTSKEGKWTTEILTPVAGGPYSITISAKDTTLTINNVYIGEVWLCSGQSNMEMPLMGWPPNDTINNSAKEIAAADYPEIRMYTVLKDLSFTPKERCVGQWDICSPENAANFSATAYFFGRELYKKLGVPIGLIHTSWGGTPAESWTSIDYLQQMADYKEIATGLSSAESEHKAFTEWLNKLPAVDINELPAEDPYNDFDLGDMQLSTPDYDDSDWKTMQLPCLWETSELGNFDGVVWFRKEFEMPEDLYPEGFSLFLGPIDDMDVTYINGVKIGATDVAGLWKKDRNYNIPESCLKKGKNVIAVRVIDPQGGGGIYGDSIAIMKGKKEAVDLSGNWKYLPIALKMGNSYYMFGEGEKSIDSKPLMKYPLEAWTPTVLYNAMIAPLVPYTVEGAIWYQGEANVGRGIQYRELFQKMIQCWRDKWGMGDFPFYYVQIAPWDYKDNGSGATPEVRDAQLRTLKVQNTGMVVTTDIGSITTIHPGNKQEVGRRLALWALAKDYENDSIIFSGPIYKNCAFKDGKAIISFDYADNGLVAKGGGLTWFEIAGADGTFVTAKATIDGDKVIAWSDKVTEPKFVRFGWSDIAEPNLFNIEGLPASPFTTE